MARAGATRAEPQGRSGGARDVRHAAAVPADRRGRLPRLPRRGRPPGAVEAPSLACEEERTALRLLAAVVAAVAVLAGLIGRAALAGASTPGMASLTRLAGTGAPPDGAGPAQVAGGGNSGCQVVHLGPATPPGQPVSSYFSLEIKAGARTTEAMELANPEPYPCSVTLLPADGTTALNGGDSYLAASGRGGCAGPGCWLAGLPSNETLPARSRRAVAFAILVPARTRGGQCLAGVIAEPGTTAPARRAAGRPGPTGHRRGEGRRPGRDRGGDHRARAARPRARGARGRAGDRPPALARGDGRQPRQHTWMHPSGELTVAGRAGGRAASP